MKRLIALLLALLMLTGCGAKTEAPAAPQETVAPEVAVPVEPVVTDIPYESRFSSETLIELSDEGIKTDALSVYASNDIIYYEDKDTYESGNPYGEGTDADKHTNEEAAAHTVVNITEPGAYRVTGKLSAGQIRVDLGDDAYEDENAVVELILDDADITCTVAPAILFLNTYECDGLWSEDAAKAEVDTGNAGANLILEGENKVSGAYVARIYKDKEGEKKLWKQDGAIYSYMSMNVYGPGVLDLNAENEGLDTELHLTINGGNLNIRSGNDGINTNEDNVSVTTINGGTVCIIAGLGAEGDGIDSNGYLVINGGTVISSAHPAADAGLDSDKGSYINSGTVIALGSTMDWAESESNQVTMNLQFASYQAENAAIEVKREDGTTIFSFDPASDAVLGEYYRKYMGAIISCPNFKQGESYLVYVNGTQMQYSGTDVQRFPGGMGGFPGGRGERPEGQMPEGFEGFRGEMPEGWTPGQGSERPEGFGGGKGQRPEGGERPEGFNGQQPADMELPEGFGKIPSQENPEMGRGFGGELPEGVEIQLPEGFNGRFPEGFEGQMPEGFEGQFPGGFGGSQQSGESSTLFYMQDKVNSFSGVSAVK